MSDLVNRLINEAKAKYPASATYKGRLSVEEARELRETCDVKTISVYMDGSVYCIVRYRR